jgi:hypothetical protein
MLFICQSEPVSLRFYSVAVLSYRQEFDNVALPSKDENSRVFFLKLMTSGLFVNFK